MLSRSALRLSAPKSAILRHPSAACKGKLQRFVCLGPSACLQKLSTAKSLNTARGLATDSHDSAHERQNTGESNSSRKEKFILLGACVGAAVFGSYLLQKEQNCKEAEKSIPVTFFGKDEISSHKTKAKGIWVTYQNNVYDITEFVDGHPGGSSKIMLAAGGELEPYWDMYAIHKKSEVLEILQEYKIGEIKLGDRVAKKAKGDGPFANEPARHPAFIVNSQQPFNAETPPELALDNLITPNELFFVRNHLPVPVIENEKDFRVEITGQGIKGIKLSLEDLETKFKKHKIIATLQCTGNRRSQMNTAKPVRGLNWTSTAISNAEWEGVLLRDILIHAGVDVTNPDSEIKHVQFEGLDVDPIKAPYGASIPAYKAFDPSCDVLIAYRMNGKPLPRDHGFPLRVVVPGVVGARNVKWLSKIVVSKDESLSHWQQNDYKGFSPNIDWHNVDFSTAPAIQESPVTSAICSPKNGTTVHQSDEEVAVSGYAYSGGGRGIIRVDVSADSGKTWHTANLKQVDQPLHRMWSWTQWTAEIPIPEGHTGPLDICCKAVDSSYNTQPENVEPIWNLRGVLNNAWFHVNVNIEAD
eukprot:Seg5373.2 transcript_id=Seg5373.2/GoldUCD/mRNA.D3Y31 product="Sulfite oxidase mitochondrial" protein_id=Seg5373.2/GoldUCD/D3Y31